MPREPCACGAYDCTECGRRQGTFGAVPCAQHDERDCRECKRPEGEDAVLDGVASDVE